MATRTTEDIQQELGAAIEELQELQVEAGHLDEAVREAIKEDHKERERAAKTGGKIRNALARRKSKVAEVRDRAEELPYELHFARVRVAELRREAARSKVPEIEAEVERTQALLPEADAKLREAQAENDAVHAAYGTALQTRSGNEEAERQTSFDLARLQRLGPQVQEGLPQSPNTI
jgi:chromosome segregation ATPase